MITHVVLRAFEVGGKLLDAGTAVNASAWRNTERLVSTKYLRPAHDVDRAARAADGPKKKLTLKKR